MFPVRRRAVLHSLVVDLIALAMMAAGVTDGTA
jgi:hypothetical protein